VRVTRHEHISLPASSAGAQSAVRTARALPGDGAREGAHGAHWQSGRAERIHAPSLGVTRMLELYRDNEAPYTPRRTASFHVFV
jgi:hypothetical protein